MTTYGLGMRENNFGNKNEFNSSSREFWMNFKEKKKEKRFNFMEKWPIFMKLISRNDSLQLLWICRCDLVRNW